MIEINSNNWNEEVLESDKITLVDIWSYTCVPCKQLMPILEKISQNKDYKICKLNAQDNKELVADLMIRNVPTCLIYKDGEIVNKFVGLLTEEEILEKLNV